MRREEWWRGRLLDGGERVWFFLISFFGYISMRVSYRIVPIIFDFSFIPRQGLTFACLLAYRSHANPFFLHIFLNLTKILNTKCGSQVQQSLSLLVKPPYPIFFPWYSEIPYLNLLYPLLPYARKIREKGKKEKSKTKNRSKAEKI